MNAQDSAILSSGQRVGVAVVGFAKELANFPPLAAAEAERADVVAALEAKAVQQDTQTTAPTTDKDTARERLATTAAMLSARAVGYALVTKQLRLKQAFTLSYADVLYGEATEDVHHVRDLVAAVRALPTQVRKDYGLTEAVLQAPADAADAFEAADDAQTTVKAAPRLATLALPELLRRLSVALRLMDTLLRRQRTDTDPALRWADFYAAFAEANKRREPPARRQLASTQARIVRTLPLTAADGQPQRLANTNYSPAYTLTMENCAAVPLRLWMAQKDGAPTTPATCPAGQITELVRRDLGPETARYLTAQFVGTGEGQATVVVRRVVE